MTVTVADWGPVRVIACSGKLAMGEPEEALVGACDDAIASGRRWIVLDFVRLTWMDSAGVGAVVACAKHAAEKGAVVKLVIGGDGAVRRVIEAVGLDRVFEIYGDVSTAAGSFPR